MTRIVWKSECCGAVVDDYKATECPDCGKECTVYSPDVEPPLDDEPPRPLHRGRKEDER